MRAAGIATNRYPTRPRVPFGADRRGPERGERSIVQRLVLSEESWLGAQTERHDDLGGIQPGCKPPSGDNADTSRISLAMMDCRSFRSSRRPSRRRSFLRDKRQSLIHPRRKLSLSQQPATRRGPHGVGGEGGAGAAAMGEHVWWRNGCRLLNFGSIHVKGTGESLEHLHKIASPLDLRNCITAR
jgi:hypothetical protein